MRGGPWKCSGRRTNGAGGNPRHRQVLIPCSRNGANATMEISTGNYVPDYLALSFCRSPSFSSLLLTSSRRTGNWQLHKQLSCHPFRDLQTDPADPTAREGEIGRAGEMVPYKEVCMFLFSSRNANLLLLLLQYRVGRLPTPARLAWKLAEA